MTADEWLLLLRLLLGRASNIGRPSNACHNDDDDDTARHGRTRPPSPQTAAAMATTTTPKHFIDGSEEFSKKMIKAP
jgi:hypothetical protein